MDIDPNRFPRRVLLAVAGLSRQIVTETIRAITADPACALHVSIAGGRKSMGYYAGCALSLFGRIRERLSHVLGGKPYESSRRWRRPRAQTSMTTASARPTPKGIGWGWSRR